MTESNKGKTKVVYITGAGRSGTTLFDVLLGELDGFFSAGEMRWLWWGGLLSGWQCGCTKPVRDCEVWREIAGLAFGRPVEDLDVERILRLQQTAMRLHYLPRLLAQSENRRVKWRSLRDYSTVMNSLYKSIAQVTGARVVVDSSKNAPDGALLRLLPDVDPYLIHLVRDPRGVANSFRRRVKMEPHSDNTFEQPRRGAAISALIWDRKNVASEMARWRYPSGRTTVVRYEDLVEDPRATIEGIARFLGEPISGLQFSGDRTVELSGNHTSWGNPSRFRRGATELSPDNEWVWKLPKKERRIATALSLPLLMRYRYPLRARA